MSVTEPATTGDLSDAELRRIYPRLRRFAAVVTPQEIDPDDLMQEALAKLLARNRQRRPRRGLPASDLLAPQTASNAFGAKILS
jgi:DNA-directed RNA polymerase specialized sigma24 family protein